MNATDVAGEGVRLVSRFVGAAISAPVVTGYVLLGAAVLVGRSFLDVAGGARGWLSSLGRGQGEQATRTTRAA